MPVRLVIPFNFSTELELYAFIDDETLKNVRTINNMFMAELYTLLYPNNPPLIWDSEKALLLGNRE